MRFVRLIKLILLDTFMFSHGTGKKFEAKTTPHVFIFKGKELIYSGAVDESPDSDPKVANNKIIIILDQLLKGEKVEFSRTRPCGCSIKYFE